MVAGNAFQELPVECRCDEVRPAGIHVHGIGEQVLLDEGRAFLSSVKQ
jgi:hypothetical protein